jgi:hypothetical protein
LRIKIDLGRIFPGILVLLIGVLLFFVWVVLALVSFFFFFLPGLQGIFYIALNLLVASLVIMAAGILVILSGTSGWMSGGSQGGVSGEGEGWFSGVVGRRLSKDRLRLSERAGEIIGVIFSLWIGLFLYENQLRGVPFFTPSFGQFEQFLFYGPLVVGAFISFIRAAYGRRNALRPLDVMQGVFWGVSAIWLLYVFPFDFGHFPDMFPSAIRFALTWVSDDVYRLLLAIAGIAGFASALYDSVLYSAVRSRMVVAQPFPT